MMDLMMAISRAGVGKGFEADQCMAAAHQNLKSIAEDLGFRLEWRGLPKDEDRPIPVNEHVLLAQGQVLAAYDELTKAQVERSATRIGYARGKLSLALGTLNKIRPEHSTAFASHGHGVHEQPANWLQDQLLDGRK
jgi:hypothetical protein